MELNLNNEISQCLAMALFSWRWLGRWRIEVHAEDYTDVPNFWNSLPQHRNVELHIFFTLRAVAVLRKGGQS